MDGRRYVILEDRGVVGLGGPEVRPFLQGLLSNDVERVAPGRAIFAALLTPQGKYLFDFLIGERDGTLLLEAERARIPDLIRRLTMYRLRAKVDIGDLSNELAVAHLLAPDLPARLGLEPAAGACCREDGGMVMLDPRLLALGGRAWLPPERLETSLNGLGFVLGRRDAYDHHRLALGVPEGSADLTLERATLLESGFEELNGVDFKKGCFVGQELTARMKYRGLVKKRLMPVTFEGPPPTPGTSVRLGDKDAGEVRAGTEGVALALLRLEQLARARAADQPLLAEGRELRPAPPPWLHLPPDRSETPA